MRSIIPRLGKIFPQSLIAEIYKVLGSLDLTEKFLTVFAGITLKIPSSKDFMEAQRNLAIYDTLVLAKTKEEATSMRALLAEQHELKIKEVRYIFRRVRRLVQEAKKLKEADVGVGRHQPSKVKVRRKKRRRW